jgi:hypothetical protein
MDIDFEFDGWLVVRTRPRLEAQGYRCYLPLLRSDLAGRVPLLPGCIFIRPGSLG